MQSGRFRIIILKFYHVTFVALQRRNSYNHHLINVSKKKFNSSAQGIGEDIAVVRICNVSDPVDLDVFNDYMMHHDFQHLRNHARELSVTSYTQFFFFFNNEKSNVFRIVFRWNGVQASKINEAFVARFNPE